MSRVYDFHGKRALVTGASQGIGRATAQLLATCGAEVIAVGRRADDLDYCERRIVMDLADTHALISSVVAALPVDLLVNCAGIVELESVIDATPESFDRTLAVNTRAPLLLTQYMARELIRLGRPGAVVNVSSLAATVGTRDHAAYCASKAALDALTRVMALELGPHGIRVNSVNPIVTLTPMAEKVWSDPVRSTPMLARVPLGRFVQPGEVANVIAFLLSDDAAMIHGTTLTVDGGFSAA